MYNKVILFKAGFFMEFIKTKNENIDDIMRIISNAQKSMKELGIDQWQDGYPDRDTFLSDIEASGSYVVTDGDAIIGTAFISFDGEPTYNKIYDGSWLPYAEAKAQAQNEKYAVIHRIAVDTSEKRKGIASFIISRAEKMCVENNIRSIKIDTHEDNFPMQNMLKKNGFHHCGTIYLKNGYKRIAFEKIINK